ncbi:dihydroxy-acid dehydratase, chloroplastic [Tanacetum coccineum]
MIAAISEDPMSFKGKVVVIRGEGPKCGPGMPEMLTPTSAIMGADLGKDVALSTDGRSSGGSQEYVVGHICPEPQVSPFSCGPDVLVQNGDIITIDISNKRMDVQLTEELNERRKSWTPPAYKAERGKTLSENAKLLPCLSEGQVILESYILSYTSSLLKNASKGKVVVTRGEGPKGGPGMPEMLKPTSAIMGGWSWQGNQSLLLDDLLPKVLGVTLSLGILQLVAIPDTVGLM